MLARLGSRDQQAREGNMVKLSVLYGQPKSADAFEKYYAETHMPIAAKM